MIYSLITRRYMDIIMIILPIIFLIYLLIYNFNNNDNFIKPLPFFNSVNNPYNLSALEKNDFNVLVNLTDFKFTINNKVCDLMRPIFLVIFVHSAPINFYKRKIIRETWGSKKSIFSLNIQLVFLLGYSNKSIENIIVNENKRYNDIIQGNFIDTYRNLTYKHVMGLKWVTYYCQEANFILKTDDDIFVDIFQLVSYLESYSLNFPPLRRFIACQLIVNPYPGRNNSSKWMVTFEEYPDQYYPQYCAGWAIIMSPDVVFGLYYYSPNTPFFWVDDVFVSGILGAKLGLKHIDFSKKGLEQKDAEDWLLNKKNSLPPLFVHPYNIKNSNMIVNLWTKTLNYYKG